jgi:phage gp46-like protein
MDFYMVEKGDGGDIQLKGGDIQADGSFRTALYLSLFSGQSFYGVYEENPSTEDFENSLNVIITPENLKTIENEARIATQWMVDSGLISSIEVEAIQVGLNRVRIDIIAQQPEEIEENFQFIWDAQLKELTIGEQ